MDRLSSEIDRLSEKMDRFPYVTVSLLVPGTSNDTVTIPDINQSQAQEHPWHMEQSNKKNPAVARRRQLDFVICMLGILSSLSNLRL